MGCTLAVINKFRSLRWGKIIDCGLQLAESCMIPGVYAQAFIKWMHNALYVRELWTKNEVGISCGLGGRAKRHNNDPPMHASTRRFTSFC